MRGEKAQFKRRVSRRLGSPPHAREKAICAFKHALYTGSPPHARGKVDFLLFAPSEAGITPACAGKRISHIRPTHCERDHPRMRGEKVWDMMLFMAPLGSPPHARGKVYALAFAIDARGITPACAGKRKNSGSGSRIPWDHPRMRGEKWFAPFGTKSTLGSPPHARGKVVLIGRGGDQRGITPACAGKRQHRY